VAEIVSDIEPNIEGEMKAEPIASVRTAVWRRARMFHLLRMTKGFRMARLGSGSGTSWL
jgi:hypothetical protein